MKSLADLAVQIQNVQIIQHHLKDDGKFPNSKFPLMVLKRVLNLDGEPNPAQLAQELFESNDWTNAWTDGIFDYQHYHSTAHEVLAIMNGSARVQFGGENGITLILERGDVVIIPAGVPHKNLGDQDGFRCVGAYAGGRDYDINRGEPGERPKTDNNIQEVPLPVGDPVFGTEGPLIKNWL